MRGILIMVMLGILGLMTTKHFDTYVPRDPFENVTYRAEMLKLAQGDKAAQAQMKQMCSEDPLFYINTFNYSYSPKDSIYGDPRTPFTLYDFQNETILGILECIDEGKDGATPKSRGVGASCMCVNAIEWCWKFREYLSFLMVSRKQDLVDDSGNPDALFWKIDYIHRYQPNWLLPTGRHLGQKDPNRKLLRMVNADTKSVISGESTTGNVGVGGRHTAILFDEFALQDDGYTAITGSRDVTNCRLGNSTPRGQNHFHAFCKKIAAKVMRLHWSRHDIYARGLYTEDENGKVELLDDYRGIVRFRKKGEKEIKNVMFPDDYEFQSCAKFKMRSPWFDYECTRCSNDKEINQELEIDFLGSDYQFFAPEVISLLKKRYCKKPSIVGDLEYDPLTLEPKRFHEHDHGKIKLWMQLDADGNPSYDRLFAIGSDVSAGTGASNSCSCVVDRETGEKIAVWKDPNTLPHAFGDITIALAKWFNNAYLVWDRSGPTGEVFAQRVEKAGYGNIYYSRNDKREGRPVTDKPGVFLNPQAKTVIFHDYRDAIDSHRYINRSESGMDECLQFIKKADGSVEHTAATNAVDPDGAKTAHGDEVVADALACLGMRERQVTKEPKEITELPYGSLAWRIKLKQDAESAKHADCLGNNW